MTDAAYRAFCEAVGIDPNTAPTLRDRPPQNETIREMEAEVDAAHARALEAEEREWHRLNAEHDPAYDELRERLGLDEQP